MKRKVSVLLLVVCCCIVFAGTFIFFKLTYKEKQVVQVIHPFEKLHTMEQLRLKKYQFIQPLLLTDIPPEGSALKMMQTKLEEYIDHAKTTRKADDISVYFRKLNDGSWFSINPNRAYIADGLMSIVYLITYLKEAETNPSIIGKKIIFTHPDEDDEGKYNKNKNDFSLKENTSYSVNDLMNYMIKYSDEDATRLLLENMNRNIYNQVFSDLNIPPSPMKGEYFLTISDVSKFFRVLYNASYVQPDYSEFGLKLLASNTFLDGLRKGVDSTIILSHKTGIYNSINRYELHEVGIVFSNNNPYLIGVMTAGSSPEQLTEIIAAISGITFREYQNLIHE